ncbi:MAG TPA: glycerate kinase [Candidatus Brocadiia bacterium]|nr:glycerate kinase [Candidatus Brocadiia bacterium]
MRIIIAPDSFKESMSALEAARAMERGVRKACPNADTKIMPMADGGEGTAEALVGATGGRMVEVTVTDPLGRPVSAKYGILGDGATAVIEMASASGLPLVPKAERNPMLTTSFGTGELILRALNSGARRLIVAVGGSATVDGGSGLAAALGARLLDSEGGPIPQGGGGLVKLARIDLSGLDPRLKECQCRVACDVTNPLCGPTGAATVYGPQKGATPEMIPMLDAGLARYARAVRDTTGRCLADVPGMGAAGGLPLSLAAFLNSEMKPGIEIVIDAVDFKRRIQGADLVITGEGRLDAQSAFGKTVCGVSRAGREAGVPVFAIAGSVEKGADALLFEGLTAWFSMVSGPMTLEDAMSRAQELAANCAEQAVRAFLASKRAGAGD